MRNIGHFLRRRPRIGIATLIILAGLGASACVPAAPPPSRRTTPTPTAPPVPPVNPAQLEYASGLTHYLDERTDGIGDEHVVAVRNGHDSTHFATGPLSVTLLNNSGEGNFQLVPVGSDCAGATLASGQSCAVQVLYESTGDDGTGSVTLRVADNGGASVDVPLTGTVRPDFEITGPTTITDPVGGGATNADYTIRYVGDDPSKVYGEIASSGEFESFTAACVGEEVITGGSCTFTVEFTAPGVGTFPATVIAHDGFQGSEVEYPIVGTGI